MMFQVQDSVTTSGDILALLPFSVLLDTNVKFMKWWTWVVKESYIAGSTKSVQSDPWPSSEVLNNFFTAGVTHVIMIKLRMYVIMFSFTK